MDKVLKSNDEWRGLLHPAVFDVMRMKGTEPAFSGVYYNHHDTGVYRCAACGFELFSSDAKYDSGSGWPSFHSALGEDHIETETDARYSMVRTEVHCSRCGGHLGHVFNDGPEPTGERFCINSASLDFIAEK